MKITYDLIKSFAPCYDPKDIGIMPDYSAPIPEFIEVYRDKVKSQKDIMWVLCRNDFMTDRELRLFAVWSARQVQHLINDERSINVLDVAEKYANGLVTNEELSAARSAARSAAQSAWSAAESAAAWSAQSAWSAWSAAAQSAAWSAQSAAESAQIDYLLDLFKNKVFLEQVK